MSGNAISSPAVLSSIFLSLDNWRPVDGVRLYAAGGRRKAAGRRRATVRDVISTVAVRVAVGTTWRYRNIAGGLLWRIGVPAVGLRVAWLVGSRLSREDTILVLPCAWLPLALWCALAPRGRIVSLPTAVGLLALIGTVRWTLPGEPGDRSRTIALSVLTWYVLPGTLALLAMGLRHVVTVSRLRSGVRRLLGARPTSPGPADLSRRVAEVPGATTPRLDARTTLLSRISIVAAALMFLLGCCCPAGVLLLDGGGAPAPSAGELFPLPPGMDATDGDTFGDGPSGCDQTGHGCWLSYRITGSPGESEADLYDRLARHLQSAKGWLPMLPCHRLSILGQDRPFKICVDMQDGPITAGRPTVDLEMIIDDV